MITRDEVQAMLEQECEGKSAGLSGEDIRELVDLLSEKDDTLRYHAFLLLQRRSKVTPDVAPYIDVFCGKLSNANSYQRSIGAMLVSANAAWDTEGKIDAAIGAYLALLHDDKPITVRQCLQALVPIIEHKPALRGVITEKLLAYDVTRVKETMRKSIQLDVLTALRHLYRYEQSDKIREYARKALSGGILDVKTAKGFKDLAE